MEEALTNTNEIVPVIIEIINTLCSNVFSSIDENIFPLLDKLVFIDNEIFSTGDKMNKLLSTSPTTGVLALANCLFTAFVLYYAARHIIANLTGSVYETPHKFFMRALLSGIAMNYALPICKFMITATNLISTFFCELRKKCFWQKHFIYNTSLNA